MIHKITIHRAENGWVVQASGERQRTPEENARELSTAKTESTHANYVFDNTEEVLDKLREQMEEG